MLQAAWNPAGGVRYHLRAQRHRDRAWAPFRQQIDAWFRGWECSAKTLVLVGPSAGYCLPLSLVERFSSLICFEVDPLARWLLSRRLRRLGGARSITWIGADAWIDPLLRGGAVPAAVLGGDRAVLFCNFVGQLPFLVRDAQWTAFRSAWRDSLWPCLERCAWASFHDRVSGPIAPLRIPEADMNVALADEQVVELYGEQRGELFDHHSSELLPPGQRYHYFHWPLIPGQHHLIEAVVGR